MKIYQLDPDLGEVRAINMEQCRPAAVTFDPSTNSLYMTCAQYYANGIYYHIRKKTFNGAIDQVIYDDPQGKKLCHFYVSVEIAVLLRNEITK